MDRARCKMCGATIPTGSSSCRDLFGTVLAREYSEPGFARVHLLTVDCYALQHSEEHGPRSNAFHLLRLCNQLEHGAPSQLGRAPDRRTARRLERLYSQLPRLEPPVSRGRETIASVALAPSVEEHGARVRAWARSVWRAWAAHHDWARAEARRWADPAG